MRAWVFFCQAEDGIRDIGVTGVQTCALPIFTTLFVIATIAAVHFRNGSRMENEENEASLEKNKIEQDHEKELDGPEEFIKFHQGIRTRSDEQRPGYPANYQWTELHKALRVSS